MTSLFPRHHFSVDQHLCFVIMPFAATFNNVYYSISMLVEDYCGLNCRRADDFSKSERITGDIWKSINEARFIIADLTSRNPNVFYELGLAHALNKPVILLSQNPSEDVPFDLREIRYIQYDPNNLKELQTVLPEYISSLITTIPSNLNLDRRDGDGAYIKLTSVESPKYISLGQPFEITLRARNIGHDTAEGYFSVSFPNGVDDLKIVEANTSTQDGARGKAWANNRLILSYPIAEGFRYGTDSPWLSTEEYYIKVQGYPKRKGLMWFYISASCPDAATGRWVNDPAEKILDMDQRNEPVYCGVIHVT
jgi:hypothetical protein